jgi:hypothetical protein
VLADSVLAGVHQRGDLGHVRLAFGVGESWDSRGPRAGRERNQGAEAVTETVVEDGGDVAGSGQVPVGDRVGQDTGGVQAGQFGGAQGPPQPPGLVIGLPAVAGRQGVHEQVAVALIPGGGGLGSPDRVQQGQVVRFGLGLVAGLSGGALLAVAARHPGQHGQRVPRRGGSGGSRAIGGRSAQRRVTPATSVTAGRVNPCPAPSASQPKIPVLQPQADRQIFRWPQSWYPTLTLTPQPHVWARQPAETDKFREATAAAGQNRPCAGPRPAPNPVLAPEQPTWPGDIALDSTRTRGTNQPELEHLRSTDSSAHTAATRADSAF